MKDFFNDLSENIFEKDFILKVLVPLAATMVFAFVFYLTSPFVLLLGLLTYAILFLITNYQKQALEDSLFYEDENTNPLREIRQEALEQLEEPEVIEEEPKPSIRERILARRKKKEPEYEEYAEYPEEYPDEEPVMEYTEEPLEPAQRPVEPEPAAKRENQGLRRKVADIPKVIRKEVPEKQDLDYDDNFEFEFGNYDE